MKPKTLAKMLIDLVMTALYLQLMFGYSNNTLFHEVAGIAIGFLFIVHVVLNANTISGLLAKARRGTLKGGRKVLLASDLFLPVGMATTIVTGMLIAKDIWLGPAGYGVFVAHNIAAYSCLAVLALHLVMHARYLVGMTRKLIRTQGFQRVSAAASVCAIVGALIWTNLFGISGTSSVSSNSVTAFASSVGNATVNESSGSTATTTSHLARGRGDEATTTATTASSSGTDTTTADSSTISSSGTGSSSDNTSTVSSSGSSDSATDDTTSTPTNCTLCGKNCPISNLRCGKGQQWAESNGYI